MTWLEENTSWLESAREHWAPRQAERVLIRAWLAQEIAFDCYDPITIEGGLQSVVCSLETGRMPDDVFVDSPRSLTVTEGDIQIPICDVHVATDGLGSIPIATVSCGWFSPDATQTGTWVRKRPRAECYAMDTVNTASAEFKATNFLKATVTAQFLEFHALGDAELLRRLLVELPSLSSSRAGGMGSLYGWEIEVDTAAKHWPSWQDESGRAMRAMPHGYLRNVTGCDVRDATLRAPYWHKRTMTLCDVPFQEVGSILC